jgi:hypothetical protein
MVTSLRAVSQVVVGAIFAGCAPSAPDPPSPRDTTVARAVVETVTVRDPELEQRVARFELRLLEREAQIEDLQARLDDARHEVVRAMARFQTLASRAEAASAMAESEITLQSMRGAGAQEAPEIAQARQLLKLAATEFNKQNYGGAVYLASQAKSLVGAGRERLASGARGSQRPGEVLFALPLRLQTASRSNVREGPGASFPIVFTAEAGTPLIGYSLADRWVRVSDEAGRSGWILQTLVGRRQETSP